MERLRQIATGEGTEVENTTTEGSLARYVFAANELSAGKVFRGTCAAVVNDNNSTDTLTLGLRFGSSATPGSNTAIATSGAVDVADADQGICSWEIHVQSTTRAVAITKIQAPDAAGTGAIIQKATVLTIAPDTPYYLDFTALWSVAHADNEVAAATFTVSELS